SLSLRPTRMSSHCLFFHCSVHHRDPPSFPTRRSSDLDARGGEFQRRFDERDADDEPEPDGGQDDARARGQARIAGAEEMCHARRSEEHTSELQSRFDLVCRLLLEKKKTETKTTKCEEV